jgi:hypothetical protein
MVTFDSNKALKIIPSQKIDPAITFGKIFDQANAGPEDSHIKQRFEINRELSEMVIKTIRPTSVTTKELKDIWWVGLKEVILRKGLVEVGPVQLKMNWHKTLITKREGNPIDTQLCQQEQLIQLLDNIIEDEFTLYQKQQIPLYRGSQNLIENPAHPPSDGTKNAFWSLSYGTSLFSGFNEEERRAYTGACAWTYLVNSDYLGQRVAVKKETLRQHQSIFFVPFLDTITSMQSSGEFFHARTLLGKGTKSDRRCKGLHCPLDQAVVQQLFISDRLTIEDIANEIIKLESPERIVLKKRLLIKAPSCDSTGDDDDVSSVGTEILDFDGDGAQACALHREELPELIFIRKILIQPNKEN